jgi:hypothetical protein
VNNDRAFQETTIGSGISAEQETAGLFINLIPRDGGNRWTGNFAVNGSETALQSANITPELETRGVSTPAKLQKLYDAGGGGGGPLVRDRLWVYGSERWWNAANFVAGSFFNATPQPAYGHFPVYTPDMSRPVTNSAPNHNSNLRLTFQAAKAQKRPTTSLRPMGPRMCFRAIGRT